MARLILKSLYLKSGGNKSPGGYLKYIATREGWRWRKIPPAIFLPRQNNKNMYNLLCSRQKNLGQSTLRPRRLCQIKVPISRV